MRRAFAAFCLAAMLGPAFAAERERALNIDGQNRKYILVTPKTASAPLPLLIVYHGGRQSAERARRYTGFDRFVDREKFVVVYPQGSDGNWNDGRVSADISQQASSKTNDVEFTTQIIAQLASDNIVDPSRVFLTGGSNGGMMALRAACELGDRIAGVAPVVANQPADWRCEAKAMPALFINGTDDEFMPFDGGQIAAKKTRRDLGQVLSVDDTIAAFQAMNGCTGVKEEKALDEVGRDKTAATITDYECARAPLRQIVIQGGGHNWPGARGGIVSEWILGRESEEIDATTEIWNFFRALPGR